MPVRAVLQRGPKDKKSVAFAVDWPGWSRGAKTADQAVETLEAYRERYRPIAQAAGLSDELDAQGDIELVLDEVGTGSTDFWGISFAPSALETEPMDDAELDRKIALLRACWAHFDAVGARVSAELAKGPRGGGRERDEIIAHVLRVESLDFAKRLGLRVEEGSLTSPTAIQQYRDDYVTLMRAYNAGEGKRMRSWNLPFLIRHTAFHVMDHAWEMADKDLSA
ncbi:hypothetical protein [Angustibacter sp. Root456]|uniref:hypothetical protein n=1 Tax=Angustibacter sp. Root456 TaxID=1736539 RepID=UPI0006FE0816|nr:hypothetical protein [Angustibacter sp. Root456]KQX66234.1 hypothetical protein ASD06_07660 [Angustibacter sp. Root456]